MIKRLFLSISIMLAIAGLAYAVITYGRGYRINLSQKSLTPTGILSVSSYPEKASIWIDGKLTSATNASISLPPNWYEVKITKEGYQDWSKKVRIQGEVVSQVDALLVPTNPSLKTLTVSGVLSPQLSASGTKIAYLVPQDSSPSGSTIKPNHGLTVLELRTSSLLGKNEPRLVFQPSASYEWKDAKITWSPDENQIGLAFIKKEAKKESLLYAFLISLNANTTSTNITSTYQNILNLWQKEAREKKELQFSSLHKSVSSFILDNATNIAFSPDETKLLYLATQSATLNPIIDPPLIGANSTQESRKIETDKYYVYDLKEDKNFYIEEKKNIASPTSIIWYTDSKHILMIENKTIYIIDYDGTNKRGIYSGPFEDNLVYSSPAGNRIIILTNLNRPNSLPNLYEVDLR